MNPSELISEIRQYINSAQLEKALEKLLPWLEKEKEVTSSWADTVRGLLSQYKTLKLAQQRLTISDENAKLTNSQITNALLGVLTAIENGEAAPRNEAIQPAGTAKTPWMPIGIVVALVLAISSFLILRKEHGQIIMPPDSDTTDDATVLADSNKCPVFAEESIFNILILPYQPLGGGQKNIDKALRIRLSNMMEKYNIAGSVKGKKFDINSSDYPATAKQAIPIAKPCKAQLIIWGFTEEIGDQTTTITKFRFLKKDHFALTGLNLNQIDTISSISSIATSQELTENIEKSIKLIFGLVALETENYALSTEMLEKTVQERGGASEVPAWGLILADSKIKNGEREAAMAIYDEILEKNDQNAEALTRKGILAFNEGNYDLAISSFNPVLAKNPENSNVRVARAAANVRANDLYQANVDLEKIESTGTDRQASKELRQEYKRRYQKEERRKAIAEEKLKTNPSDTSALRIQAQAARNLGQFEIAGKAASSLLAKDPQNMAALITLMEIKPMVRDTIAIQSIIKQTQQQFNPTQIRMMKPRLLQIEKQ